MNGPSLVKRLTFNQFVVSVVRFLHIGSLAKRFYFKLFAPNNRKIELSFEGISAQFYVNNFEQLLSMETIFKENDKDEGNILGPLIEILQPGDVAYDIGANVGIHTIFMAKKVGEEGKIIAFEPETKNYEALKKNIRLNCLNNVVPMKIALGDRVDVGNLYVRTRVGSGTVSFIKSEESEFCQQIEITPGDFLVQTRNLPIPKAVKIDVEGYEYPVIKGLQETLSREICQLVCCEIHSNLFPPGTSQPMVLDLSKSLGFKKIETHNRGSEIHAICYKK